jgi:ribonuclease HI
LTTLGEAACRGTNNAAEIEATTEAIVLARSVGIEKLKIHTDSKFVIQCANDWMPNWKRNGWMTSKKEAVKNRGELELLDAAINQPGTRHWKIF